MTPDEYTALHGGGPRGDAHAVLSGIWPRKAGQRVLADWLAAMDIRDLIRAAR